MELDDKTVWKVYSEVYGFLGNSFLAPMTISTAAGIDASFWDDFPTFNSQKVENGINNCKVYLKKLEGFSQEKAVERVAVEYTYLFIGPPSPAAPPWETSVRNPDATSTFGEATFHMRSLMRKEGIALKPGKHQFEDHIGLELLYLSVLSDRTSKKMVENSEADLVKIQDFIESHPFGWINDLRALVDKKRPGGYISSLLLISEGVLESHVSFIAFE